MRVKNENLLDDSGAVSLGANATLNAVWLGHIAQYAIQLVFTGSPVGTFKLQASNDVGHINSATGSMQVSDLANWTDIAGSAVAVSAAGDVMWNAENVGYNWVRVVYTRTSGTGSLTSARVYMKGV